jgi:hypothetical protein
MPESVMFVQFPHPGSEHRPTGASMDWNRRAHARKFLKARGTFVSDGEVQSGPLAFWGEWEPQSRVLEAYPKRGDRYPRWLHEPHWRLPQHRLLLQNTDPLVFGDRFLYSNCRQARNGKLRELAPGSLVVFGSKLDGEFVMDTVFVVGDRSEDFTRAAAGEVQCDDWIRAVVFDPLRLSPKSPNETFRLYQGTTFDEAPSGPFSFVPCRPFVQGDPAFPRPVLRLPRRWIEPNLAMGAKATAASSVEIRELWTEIFDQVAAKAGLALAVHLDPPPHAETIPVSAAG